MGPHLGSQYVTGEKPEAYILGLSHEESVTASF
jgi:hypothetical protein